MPSIDERVVSMAFENANFERGIAQTMHSLSKLDTTLQTIGTKNSLLDIEKAANKVTLEQPMSALDKLKARFSHAGTDAADGLNDIEKAGNKVQLEQPIRALNKVQSATADVGRAAPDAFNQIEKSSSRVSLQGLNASLDSVTAKFSVLSGAASVALGNVASQAGMKGTSFAKSFAFGPIMQGFDEYQTNLGSIQTVMANTEGQRVSGLDATNKALNQLNKYSDQTIYNFSQMAKNVGTFTAAGVDLPTSVAAIKGIANLAALSGSNAGQASTAMYQLSQAIAAGKVGLQDWNSVVNAGMGGRKFQNSLIQTAVAMGTLEKGAVKIDKATGKATINGQSFRESMMSAPGKESWMTSEVLTGSLKQFTGDMTDAQLKAEGFTDAQIKSIQATAKTAKKAATEVKTLPQAFDVAREAIGSGWATTFSHIFGNFNQAKKLFTDLSTFINGLIGQNSKARNDVLKAWNKGGGRLALIEGIKNAFKALFDILRPIGEAFRDIFPRKSADDLIRMSENFKEFTARLRPSAETIDGIKRTARGFFAVLHIGWSIVKGVIGVIAELLGVVGKGSGGFLNFTGSIGDFLVAVDNALTKGGLLTSFFSGIAAVLKVPLQILTGITSAIFGLFSGVDSAGGDEVAGSLDKVAGASRPLANALDTLKKAWDGFKDLVRTAKDLVSPWLDQLGSGISGVFDAVGKALDNGGFDALMEALQTTFIGGIFFAIKKALGGGGGLSKVLKPLNDVLGGLTGNLKAMQTHVKAQVIVLIATAIALLAASVFVLSKVDASGLKKAMTTIAVGLGELIGAMGLLGKFFKGPAIVGMPILAGSMILMAGSMVILGGAMKIMATMNWEEMAKGLVGVAGGIAAMAVGSKAMGPMGLAAGPALIAMAFGLNIMALAVKQFASLSWEDLARGLVGVFGSLLAISIPLGALGMAAPMLLPIGAGLVVVAFAMNMLAGAVLAFGSMDLSTLAKGILASAVALTAIGIAIWSIPPHAALMGAGLILVAIALNGIATALKVFGSMSIWEIAKGLIAMGGAIVILGLGLTAMILALPGAAALLVAALALSVIAPTLAFMGTLKWSTIFKGLAAIGLALATIGVVGAIAAPGIALLGAALLPMGLALVAVGAATYFFAAGMQKLAGEGTKGIGVFIAAVAAFAAVLPTIIIDFIMGLVDILNEMAKIAPDIVDALVKILDSLIEVVIQSGPRLALALGMLVDMFVQIILRDSPKMIQAGLTLFFNLLKGLEQNTTRLVSEAALIVIKFLTALTAKAPALSAAGSRFIIAFLNGIAKHAHDISSAAVRVVIQFMSGLVTLPGKLLNLAGRAMLSFLRGLGNKIPEVIKAGVRIVTKTLNGISSQFDEVANTATRFVTRFFNAFGSRQNTRRMANAGFKAAINVLRGLTDAIQKDENLQELFNAAEDLGLAIVEGIVRGLAGLPAKLAEKLLGPLGSAANTAKGIWESFSPSRVMIRLGKSIVDGMGIGLGGMNSALRKGITNPLAYIVRANNDGRMFGKFLGNEFSAGLTGGLFGKKTGSEAQNQIQGAFTALKTKLGEEQSKLREQLNADEAELKELMGKKVKDWDKIRELYSKVFQEKIAVSKSKAASIHLIRSMSDEKSSLMKLSKEYEKVSASLETAKGKLQQLKDERSQFISSTQSTFNTLPDVDALVGDALSDAQMTASERADALRKKQKEDDQRRSIDQVALYKDALTKQIAATKQYMVTLAALRAAGLDDTTYKKLLEKGTAGQEFASQLLASGKTGIAEINSLDGELAKTSMSLAKKVADDLFAAGISAAQGLVRGLKTQQTNIRDAMAEIADLLIKVLKRKLGIKSPSQMFAELGHYSGQGLANGLLGTAKLVRKSAESVGDEAAVALTNSLADISKRVQDNIDAQPTITPVLDLTQVQRDAKQLQDLGNVIPITAAASYGLAGAISQQSQTSADAQSDVDRKMIEVKLEQHNTSPKALDEVEIYRQTRNQLSQVKSALDLAK